jgi:hypothetical protein
VSADQMNDARNHGEASSGAGILVLGSDGKDW